MKLSAGTFRGVVVDDFFSQWGKCGLAFCQVSGCELSSGEVTVAGFFVAGYGHFVRSSCV
jgi:hypothetical protein